MNVKIMINRTLACLLLLSVSACTDPVKNELIQYINQDTPPVFAIARELEASHAEAKKSVENSESDEVILASWGIALTQCRKYEEAATAISQKLHTPEIRELNETLISAAHTLCAGMLGQLDAMDKEDLRVMNRANKQLHEAQQIQRKWQSQLEKLKQDHRI